LAEEAFAFPVIEDITLMGIGQDMWLADSATTSHVVLNKKYFETFEETPGQQIQGLSSVAARNHPARVPSRK